MYKYHKCRSLCRPVMFFFQTFIQEELVLEIQSGGLVARSSWSCNKFFFFGYFWWINWLSYRLKSHFLINFNVFYDPSRSKLIRVDPTRTGDLSWSGPTFVPACKIWTWLGLVDLLLKCTSKIWLDLLWHVLHTICDLIINLAC